jgi:hypothetical protein
MLSINRRAGAAGGASTPDDHIRFDVRPGYTLTASNSHVDARAVVVVLEPIAEAKVRPKVSTSTQMTATANGRWSARTVNTRSPAFGKMRTAQPSASLLCQRRTRRCGAPRPACSTAHVPDTSACRGSDSPCRQSAQHEASGVGAASSSARCSAAAGWGVVLVGFVQFDRDARAGVEVDRMLGLVGQTGTDILQLGDPRVGIDRAFPAGVRPFPARGAQSNPTR